MYVNVRIVGLKREVLILKTVKMGSKIALAIGLVVLIALLMVFPLMWCWNYVMPDLFGLAEIDWKQAFVLNILSSILFKSSNSSSSSK